MRKYIFVYISNVRLGLGYYKSMDREGGKAGSIRATNGSGEVREQVAN